MEILESSGGCPPSGAEEGERGYTGATYGAGIVDVAYKGLGDFVLPHSRALNTALVHATRCAILTGLVNNFISLPLQ